MRTVPLTISYLSSYGYVAASTQHTDRAEGAVEFAAQPPHQNNQILAVRSLSPCSGLLKSPAIRVGGPGALWIPVPHPQRPTLSAHHTQRMLPASSMRHCKLEQITQTSHRSLAASASHPPGWRTQRPLAAHTTAPLLRIRSPQPPLVAHAASASIPFPADPSGSGQGELPQRRAFRAAYWQPFERSRKQQCACACVCSAASTSTLPGSQTQAPIAAPLGELPITGWDKVRALLFFGWSFLLALPLFVTMMAMAPFVMLFDKSR